VKTDEKRIWLFGVVNACPLNVPLDICPFNEIRNKPVTVRWKFVCDLSDVEVDSFIDKHLDCLYKREMKRFKSE
jgi:hypothetical protein